MLASWKKSYEQPRQNIKKQRKKKKQRNCFTEKGLYRQSYGFSKVVMYGCESWTIKKAEL